MTTIGTAPGSRSLVRTTELTLDEQWEVRRSTQDPGVMMMLAMNLWLHRELQEDILGDDDGTLRGVLAFNGCISRSVMDRLVEDVPGVRAALATNPSLPEDLALTLAQDPDQSVRYRLARNPDISDDVQRILSEDPNVLLQVELTENPAFRPSVELSVRFLVEVAGRIDYIEEHLEGCDPAAKEALKANWSGSLADLRDTLLELGPDAS